MFNWGIGIAPDVLKSRLQTGEIQFFLDHIDVHLAKPKSGVIGQKNN